MFKKKPNQVEVPEAGGVVEITATNKTTGEPVDTAVLEEADIAFDPSAMHLQLSKEEKRRTTALMLAIQAYDHLIIKDAEYLREAHSQARSNGSVIQPATMDAMVVAALQFDAFISGRLIVERSGIMRSMQSQETDESAKSADAVDPAGEKVTE